MNKRPDRHTNVISTRIALLVAACMLGGVSVADEPADAPAAPEYSARGADNCLMCHRGEEWSVMGIFNTKHGSRTDPAAPMQNAQCEACHGPSKAHVTAKDKAAVKPAITFGDDAGSTAAEQNGACTSCHNGHPTLGWFGSAHEATDTTCVSCHELHVERDPMLDPVRQQEACFTCHPRTRADTFKASGHPLRFGKMSCSDCHDVHDGNNDFLLAADSVNENCATCHADKRGPFLWEHAPVTESCTLCHEPHGSSQPAMLTRRPPLLCQQCHSAAGHPGDAYTGDDLEESPADRFLVARACMNCHAQVHGSNHPSGASLTR